MTKLILGTAQFGSDYGIKHDGQPSEKEIERIAQVAWDRGIRTIHTSWQYGLPKICESMFEGFSNIYKDIINPEYFWNDDVLGISIYEMGDLVFSGNVKNMMIPVNVLDNRFLTTSQGAKKNGWSVLARSCFLQGLLLMDDLPNWVSGKARGRIKLFHYVCKKEQYEPYEAALGWVLGLEEVDKVIVGVNSARQLEQLLKVSPLKWDYDFSVTDEVVLDPRKWPKA